MTLQLLYALYLRTRHRKAPSLLPYKNRVDARTPSMACVASRSKRASIRAPEMVMPAQFES